MIYLTDPTLGTLDLSCDQGYVVTSFEVGWPEVRSVSYNRALSDGAVDTTEYLGARAITVALRLDQRVAPTQALIDRVAPFVSPRYRPTIVWTVEDSPSPCPTVIATSACYNPVRSLMLRGANAPLVVNAPKYLELVLQWVAQDSYVSAIEERCEVVSVTGTDEFGRPYDLDFDRDYPFSPVYGILYFDTCGNAPMDWSGTLVGEMDDPQILINDTTIEFSGLTLTAGQTINIDTKERTILRNNDVNDSVYGLTNFADWTWDDLRLTPGTNQMRLEGTNVLGSPYFTLCWYDKWFL